MTKEWLTDRARALEDEYFRRKDDELIARLRAAGRRERARRTLETRLGDIDDEVVDALVTAGFSADTLAVVHLMPLVDVAWADGAVSPGERALIVALAARRGVEPGTHAYTQLAAALDTRPSPRVLDAVYEVIRARFALEAPPARGRIAAELTTWATRVAEATGGILGLMPITAEERACLRRIAERTYGRAPA